MMNTNYGFSKVLTSVFVLMLIITGSIAYIAATAKLAFTLGEGVLQTNGSYQFPLPAINSYNFVVDWGDGKVERMNTRCPLGRFCGLAPWITHTFPPSSTNQTYQVTVTAEGSFGVRGTAHVGVTVPLVVGDGPYDTAVYEGEILYLDPVAQQPTPTQTKTPASTQTPKVETTNWLSFNSVKDAGIEPDFSFKHPSNWIQKGSIDGGAASYIPFYDKDTYSQKCDAVVNGATTCHVTGQVASALVSGPSMSPAKIEYNSETKEAVTIDGYQGTKIAGTVKSGVELNPYIGKPGQKEMRVIVPNVNGIRFEFTMLVESKTDEATFSEILKMIVFNF